MSRLAPAQVGVLARAPACRERGFSRGEFHRSAQEALPSARRVRAHSEDMSEPRENLRSRSRPVDGTRAIEGRERFEARTQCQGQVPFRTPFWARAKVLPGRVPQECAGRASTRLERRAHSEDMSETGENLRSRPEPHHHKKEAGGVSAPRSVQRAAFGSATACWHQEGSSSEPSSPSRSRCRRSRRSTHQRWPSRHSTSRRPR